MPRLILPSNLLAALAITALLSGGFLSLASPAMADVIYLTNGRTMEGTVTLLDDGRIRLDASIGTLIFSADKVDRIESADTLESTVWSALAALPEGDVEGRLAIASWVETYGNHTLAKQVRNHTVQLAPESPDARAALGQQKVDGDWMTEREYRAARQQVRYGNRWVSRDEAQELELRDAELHLARQHQGLLREQLQLERERLDLAYQSFDSPDDEAADSDEGYALQGVQPSGFLGFGLDPFGLAPRALIPQGAGVVGGAQVPGYLLTRRPFKGQPGVTAPQGRYDAQAPAPRHAPNPQAQRPPGTAPPQQPRLTGPRHNRGGFDAPKNGGSSKSQ